MAESRDQRPGRLDELLARLEAILPPLESPGVLDESTAFRWRKSAALGASYGRLEAIRRPHRIDLDDLLRVREQLERVDRNTRQFVEGRPANNVLLTGARGTGKSSIVKGLLARYAKKGLRLIEVDKTDLVDLPAIVDRVAARRERFIVFCDDLTFESGDAGYVALKVALEGSLAGTTDNVVIYATSNRRHLVPEYMTENLETNYVGEEIHPGDSVEEKISLSERFGVWVHFYPFDQDEYLAIVANWLGRFGATRADVDLASREALQWALARGSRSGRVAHQFARDWAGRRSGRVARRR